jgi:hypothetical protein
MKSNTRKITLVNNFHKTEVTLTAKNNRLSAGQVRSAQQSLCGVRGCKCGGMLGERGDLNPDYEPILDPFTGRMIGAHIENIDE